MNNYKNTVAYGERLSNARRRARGGQPVNPVGAIGDRIQIAVETNDNCADGGR